MANVTSPRLDLVISANSMRKLEQLGEITPRVDCPQFVTIVVTRTSLLDDPVSGWLSTGNYSLVVTRTSLLDDPVSG